MSAKASVSETISISRWWKNPALAKQHLGPLGLYLLGAIIFTWPLALHLADRVISDSSGDTFQHLWHLWWVKYSLLDLKTLPFYTDLLYYPQHTDLLLDSLGVSTGVLSIPLQLIFGLVASYNLVILLSVTLAGYSTYLLARYLSGNYRAALVAGVIFAYSPLLSVWLNLGQLDLLPAFWFPLYVLLYLKTLRGEGRWRWNAAGAIACFVVMSLASWYFTYFGLIFSGLALLYHLLIWRRSVEAHDATLFQKSWWKIALRGIATPGLAGLLLSPVLLRTIGTVGGEQNLGRQTYYNFWLNSASLSDFVWPGQSAFWGLLGSHAGAGGEWLFLGLVALVLALVGLVTSFRKTWFWGVVGLVFLELSLGPTLKTIAQNESLATAADAENGLPTPNRLLYALPFGDIARIPLAGAIVLYLALAILAAFGLVRLLKIPRLSRFVPVVVGVAVVLVFVEFLPTSRTLADTAYPDFYRTLAADTRNYAVLDLPDKADYLAMYYQTLHEKPMVGGYTARQPAYPFALTPGIKELRSTYPATLPRDIFDPALYQNTPAVLNYYNLQYVIYHLDYLNVPENYRVAHLEYLNQVFRGARPYYQDKAIIVWRVSDLPGATTACSAQSILPGRMGGWNERQFDDSGAVYRWMDGFAEVNFINPAKQPLTVTLTTEAESYQKPRTLQLLQQYTPTSRDYQLVQEVTVGAQRAPLQLKLTLQPGPNRVQFKTFGPGEKVDNRVQAIRFFPFKLEDASPTVCK